VLSADVMAGLSVVLLLAVIGLLSGWTAWYASRIQARHDLNAQQAYLRLP
jgi:hypothetical protein